jgi:hypothetical protein
MDGFRQFRAANFLDHAPELWCWLATIDGLYV